MNRIRTTLGNIVKQISRAVGGGGIPPTPNLAQRAFESLDAINLEEAVPLLKQALDADPAKAYREFGKYYASKGDACHDQAEKAFKRAELFDAGDPSARKLGIEDNNLSPRIKRMNAFDYLTDVRLEAAVESLELLLDGDKVFAYVGLGHFFVDKDDGKAEAAFKKAIGIDPENKDPYFGLASLYLKQGRLDQKEKVLQKAAKRLERYTKRQIESGHTAPINYTDLARAYMFQGRYEEAKETLHEAVAHGSSEAKFLLRDIREREAKAVEFSAHLRSSEHFMSATLHISRDEYDEAEAKYKEAIKLDPKSPIYHNSLARCYLKQGRHKEAEAEFLESIRLNPDYFEARRDLGVFYKEQGRLEEAIEQFKEAGKAAEKIEEATKRKDNLAVAYRNLSGCYIEQNRLEEATGVLESAVKKDLSKNGYGTLSERLADCYLKLNRVGEAIEVLEKAVTRDMHSYHLGRLYNKLVDCHCQQNRHEEAIGVLQRAVKLDFKNFDLERFYEKMGDLYYQLDKKQEAKSAYQQAVDLGSYGAGGKLAKTKRRLFFGSLVGKGWLWCRNK